MTNLEKSDLRAICRANKGKRTAEEIYFRVSFYCSLSTVKKYLKIFDKLDKEAPNGKD